MPGTRPGMTIMSWGICFRKPPSSREIEQQQLGVGVGFDRDALLVFDGGAVAFAHLGVVEREDAAGDLHPDSAAGRDVVRDALARGEIGDEEARILIERQRAVPTIRRGDEAQLALPLVAREGLLLIARRQAGALGNEPDLEEMDRLGWRRVELAVDDAGAGAHVLHLAGPYHGAVAEAVLVLERAG